jgi:hypothetical protein
MTRPHIKLRSIDDTSLFDPAPVLTATAVVVRSTCRVCELPYATTTDRPALLCDACALDLVKTRAHIQTTWDLSERSYYETSAALTRLVDAADSATQTRYGVVRAALIDCLAMPSAALTKRLDAAEAKGDALSPIVKAARALIAAKRQRTGVEVWARRALDAVAMWDEEGV